MWAWLNSDPLAGRADSRAFYYSGGLGGRVGNWVDGTAFRGTKRTQAHENHYLAKVRVAGSESRRPLHRRRSEAVFNPDRRSESNQPVWPHVRMDEGEGNCAGAVNELRIAVTFGSGHESNC